MSRKRLTREETREQTTQRLLDAAAKVIARKGLDATSVEDIAEAAGYSRGAFYSNFSAKEDLFIELLRRDHARVTAELASLRSDDLPLDHIEARVTEFYGHMYRDNECFINWAEARLLAVRDARFRVKLNALLAEKRDQIAAFCQYFYDRLGVTPPLPTQTMALGFMSLAEGVKLSMLSNPADMSSTDATSVMTLFAQAIMQAAKARREVAKQDALHTGSASKGEPQPRRAAAAHGKD
jgi:AcrR family transcriptional regulator